MIDENPTHPRNREKKRGRYTYPWIRGQYTDFSRRLHSSAMLGQWMADAGIRETLTPCV